MLETYRSRDIIVLVVVVIVALALCAPAAAFAFVALLAGYAIAQRPGRPAHRADRFAPRQPAAAAPAPPAPGRDEMPFDAPFGGRGEWRAAPYPGTVSEMDLENYWGDGEPSGRLGWDGDADRYVDDVDVDSSERDGAPWVPGRGAPGAGGPACYDDEANGEIDGDEMLALNSTSRNDATRVTAGSMNRLRDLDRYFREEVEERENDVWWGRHEV